jgi:hypothetical protein
VFFGLEYVFAFGQRQQISSDAELQTQYELLLGREKLMNPSELRVHIASKVLGKKKKREVHNFFFFIFFL